MKIALISDVHEDIVSLKRAFHLIELEKCDRVICLGDILGYPHGRASYRETRNASECIALIKHQCHHVVIGNHDLFHLQKFPKQTAGFSFPENWYELSASEKWQLSEKKVWHYDDDLPVELSEDEHLYLASLPESLILPLGDLRVHIAHFVYPNFSGYVSGNFKEEQKLKAHFNFLTKNNCQLSICGHMHIEGVGINYDKSDSLLGRFFDGFMYFSYGEKKIKPQLGCITIPALADNSQVNGFAILDTQALTINAISLNPHRRFIM